MDQPNKQAARLLAQKCAGNCSGNAADSGAKQKGTQRIPSTMVREIAVGVANGVHPCSIPHERVTTSREYLHAAPPVFVPPNDSTVARTKLLNRKQRLGLRPELLKPVKSPLLNIHNVDDNVSIIKKNPASVRAPFGAVWAPVGGIQRFQEFAGNRS